jgi:hypothetical protein
VAFEITTDVNSKGDDRFWLFYNHKSTGVNQQALLKNKINVYPNPASSKTIIHLNLDKSNTVSYAVTNSLGQLVYSAPQLNLVMGTKDIEINTTAWADGMYFMNLQVGNRNVKTKLVIAH